MKHRYLLSLIGLCLGIVWSSSAAQSFRTDINPALTYYQALAALPDVTDADRHHLFSTEWRGRSMDTKFEQLIAKYDNAFKFYHQAAQSRVSCDWGLDFSAGPELLLPSLAKAKSTAQIARLRVMWHLKQDRPEQAQDDLIAAFALSRNLAKDGLVISALVQFSMENILANTVAENIFEFTPERLDQIMSEIDRTPAQGTIRECMKMERATSGDWFLAKIRALQAENPGKEAVAMAKARALLERTLGGGDEPDPRLPGRLISAAGGTTDGLISRFEALGPLYDEATTLLGLPYREFGPAVAAFEGRVEKSQNPFTVCIPTLSKARGREFFTQVRLAMLKAGVDYRCGRMDAFHKVMDPCGSGPFAVERLVVAGVDRGFLLKSELASPGYEAVLAFPDKKGTPLYVDGKKVGQPVPGQPTIQ